MATGKKQGSRESAFKAQKGCHPALIGRPGGAFCAKNALSLGPSFFEPVEIADVLAAFPGARIVETVDPPMPAGHVALFEAGRAAGFPWLRVWGVVVGRGEDAWQAWLCHWVSPGALACARAALARGMGLAAPPAGDGIAPPRWRANLEADSPEWTSSAAQTCCWCGGQRWRRTGDGDECVACHPTPGPEHVR
jgi:hypothetical protein